GTAYADYMNELFTRCGALIHRDVDRQIIVPQAQSSRKETSNLIAPPLPKQRSQVQPETVPTP
ncbi:hypothetical protein CHS0354_037538, partial [Potamilus streckersoni]